MRRTEHVSLEYQDGTYCRDIRVQRLGRPVLRQHQKRSGLVHIPEVIIRRFREVKTSVQHYGSLGTGDTPIRTEIIIREPDNIPSSAAEAI